MTVHTDYSLADIRYIRPDVRYLMEGILVQGGQLCPVDRAVADEFDLLRGNRRNQADLDRVVHVHVVTEGAGEIHVLDVGEAQLEALEQDLDGGKDGVEGTGNRIPLKKQRYKDTACSSAKLCER